MTSPPKGRAVTPEQKREIVERVLRVWNRCPYLRLGQLLASAEFIACGASLFYVEDRILAQWVEDFAKNSTV